MAYKESDLIYVQGFTIANHESHIIHQMITSAVPRSSLLSVYINSSDNNDQNRAHRLRNGLFTRQSYLITGITRVRTVIDGIQSMFNCHRFSLNPSESLSPEIVDNILIRLKNVFGNGEWNGGKEIEHVTKTRNNQNECGNF